MMRGTVLSATRLLFALSLSLGALRVHSDTPTSAHFADADDQAKVAAGRSLYMTYCGSCHGRSLQGQPLWQLEDDQARRRAPAHDASGHTWQHADEEIFRMIKFGRFASAPPNSVSYMPSFAGDLSDDDILDAMAYIKSQWPLGIRASQSMLNPGFSGMPTSADSGDWTLPPTCTAAQQRWRELSR